MDQDEGSCRACGEALTGDDRFCGACGEPAPQAAPDGPFFRHALGRAPGLMSNDTRYLCAAAYLNRNFANRVLQELVGSRRAVVPSLRIDLGPVLRHCLRARTMILTRDSIMLALVLVALFISWLPVAGFAVVAVLAGYVMPALHWDRRGPVGKVLIVTVFLAASAIVLVQTLVGALLETGAPSLTTGAPVAAGVVITPLLVFMALIAGTWAVELGYRLAVSRTLLEQLQPGRPAPPPGRGEVERRITAVEAAQWGNVALYGSENPFMGHGREQDRHWSIAIQLGEASFRVPGVTPAAARRYVRLDPVAVHRAVRQRLLALADEDLPPSERISGLEVDDHLVGSGVLPWGSPLLDQTSATPFSEASTPAVTAMIHHPQAALRYYQRVSVIDRGPQVMHQGRKVIDGSDQGIAVSAFIYVAVEGRTFYLQFVRTALPPVSRPYQLVDLWAGASGRLQLAVAQAFRNVFGSVVNSPAGIWSALRTMAYERRVAGGLRIAEGSVYGNFGAQVSVRELGAAPDFGTHLRTLDVEKYTSIIERVVLETVQDYLAAQGIDTSAFGGSAASIINGNVISVGDISGSQVQIASQGHLTSHVTGTGAPR